METWRRSRGIVTNAACSRYNAIQNANCTSLTPQWNEGSDKHVCWQSLQYSTYLTKKKWKSSLNKQETSFSFSFWLPLNSDERLQFICNIVSNNMFRPDVFYPFPFERAGLHRRLELRPRWPHCFWSRSRLLMLFDELQNKKYEKMK